MAGRDKSSLRSLMRQSIQKKEKKIDSPLVRYNELGQAVCRVCNVVVKAESLWNAHLASPQHNKNAELLKARTKAASNPTGPTKPLQKNPLNRTVPTDSGNENDRSTIPSKAAVSPKEPAKPKGSLPDDFFDGSLSSKAKPEIKDFNTVKKSIPAIPATPVVQPLEKTTESYPNKETENNGVTVKGQLPEGFFDNKEHDNKARGVKVQKLDISDEMKEFQKVINEDIAVVDSREDEEEGEAAEAREFEESIAQKSFVERVMMLKKRKEELRMESEAKRKKEEKVSEKSIQKNQQETNSAEKAVKEDDDDDDDYDEEEEEEEFHDWRAKQL